MYGVIAGDAILNSDVMAVAIKINNSKNSAALIKAINAIIDYADET